MTHLAALALDQVPGTVSVWFGPPGGPATFTRLPDAPHYAASMAKLPLLVAVAAGGNLDRQVPVVNTFTSARDTSRTYGLDPRHDPDPEVWAHLGGTVALRWLAERMIVCSSNLAANLILAEVGVPAADAVWRRVGAQVSRVRRGLGDDDAREAGLTNTVSAADLAALLGHIAGGASPDTLDPLLRQQRREDLAAGLPPGTRVAHKNGWIRGVRHAAGIVFPDDAAPFVLVVCATTSLAVNVPGDAACRLIRTVTRAAWDDRQRHGDPAGPGDPAGDGGPGAARQGAPGQSAR